MRLVVAGTVFLCACCAGIGTASAVPRYVATPIVTLGGDYGFAHAINARGQVTGEAALGNGIWHAFLWDDAGMRDLDVGQVGNSRGLALNASGQVVGCAAGYGGDFAVLHDGSRLQDLRVSTGDPALVCATGINDAGHIVGTRRLEVIPFVGPSFLFEDGTLQDVWQSVTGLNNGDDMAGTADRHFNPDLGWVRVAGTYRTPYPQLDYNAQSFVTAINDHGHAVGYGSYTPGTNMQAFMFVEGVRTDIARDFVPAALNNRDVIAGQLRQPAGNRAALFIGGVVYDLNDLVLRGLDGATLTDATGINDSDMVVANVCIGTGSYSPPNPRYAMCTAYRLTPVDDVASGPAKVPTLVPVALVVLAALIVLAAKFAEERANRRE